MGHFNSSNDNQIVQSLPNIFPNGGNLGLSRPGNYSQPVYYNGTVFFAPVTDNVMAFPLTNGLLPSSPKLRSSETYDEPGGTLAVSASGNTNGILWAVRAFGVGSGGLSTSPGTLYAYDANNLSGSTFNELYNSNQAGARDTLDLAAKFNVPTVANGRVYVGSMSQLTVYGLLP